MSKEQHRAKDQVMRAVDSFIDIPVKSPKVDRKLATGMGRFLTEQGYIRGVKNWEDSWGFKYEDKTVWVAGKPMPGEEYYYYIFRLGRNPEDGQPLYPAYGDETDRYRFLHEVGHAWQDYEMDQEGAERWHQRAIDGEIDSPIAMLFGSFYRFREANPGKGFSTWGNVPNYSSITDPRQERAARAWEDTNEMLTMYLWNPDYFGTYLSYLAGEIPGYGEADLAKDGLIKIRPEDKGAIRHAVETEILQIKIKTGQFG